MSLETKLKLPFRHNTLSATLRLLKSLGWAGITYAFVALFCAHPMLFSIGAVIYTHLQIHYWSLDKKPISAWNHLSWFWIGPIWGSLGVTALLTCAFLWIPSFANLVYASITLLGLTPPMTLSVTGQFIFNLICIRQFENIIEASWYLLDCLSFLLVGHWMLTRNTDDNPFEYQFFIWWLIPDKDTEEFEKPTYQNDYFINYQAHASPHTLFSITPRLPQIALEEGAEFLFGSKP